MPGPMCTWISGAMLDPSSDHTVLGDPEDIDAEPGDDVG